MSLWRDVLLQGLSRVRVVHRLPGRLRLHVALLAHVPEDWRPALPLLEEMLRIPRGISEVRVEPRTGKVLVAYDPQVLSEEDILADVRAALAWGRRHQAQLVTLQPEDAATVVRHFKATCADSPGARLAETLTKDFPDVFRS